MTARERAEEELQRALGQGRCDHRQADGTVSIAWAVLDVADAIREAGQPTSHGQPPPPPPPLPPPLPDPSIRGPQ